MMKIGICGVAGRMGREVLSVAAEMNIRVVLGIEVEAYRGANVGRMFPSIGYVFPLITSPSEMDHIRAEDLPDVVIDFSTAGAVIPYIEHVVMRNLRIGFVIGTTGFSEQELKAIERSSASLPIFISYNMSRGINLLLKVLPEMKKNLPDFDVEIVEIHHRMKRDSPSGTAIRLADVLSDRDTIRISGRDGMVGPRKKNELGIFAVRGGDVVGEHIVFFLGDGERLEIKHAVSSRRVFASGSLYAARLIYEKLKTGENGLFRSMF